MVTGEPFEEELSHVSSFYGNDVNHFQLKAQFPLLAPTARAMGFDFDSFNFYDVIEMSEQLEAPRKSALSEVLIVGKILFVMPAQIQLVKNLSMH